MSISDAVRRTAKIFIYLFHHSFKKKRNSEIEGRKGPRQKVGETS